MNELESKYNFLEKLMNAKSFNDFDMEEKKILNCCQSLIRDLLQYKDKAILLRTQIQKLNETHSNLKEEFDFLLEEKKVSDNSFSSEANFVTFSSDSGNSFEKNKTRQLNDQIKSLENIISSLKEDNQNLKSQILNQEDLMEKQSSYFMKKIENKNKIISSLQQELNKITSSQTKKNKSVSINNSDLKLEEQQKIRTIFSHIISEFSSRMSSSISNLYFALTSNQNKYMRPLILFVLFSIRWINIKKKKFPFDQSSLMLYTSSHHLSYESKIDVINSVFKSLTDELSNAKHKLFKNIQTTQKVVHNCNEIESELNDHQNKYLNFQRQIKFYKSKIVELNEEMSTMISAEKFDEKLKHYAAIDLENDKLKSNIIKLEQIIEEKDNEIMKCQQIVLESEVQHEFDINLQKESQNKIESQKDDIKSLNVRLKGRTKDLLAYERMGSNMNKLLFSKQIPAQPEDDIKCDFTKENINPKFLVEIDTK